MPGDLGSFITDASGKFHNISKGAFDTFGMKHGGKFDPDFAKLLKGSFSDGVKNILGKAGLSAEQLETFGTTSFIETLKEVVTGVGAEVASTAAGTAMGGPIGAAFGFAMETGQLVHKFQAHGSWDPDVSYGSGQWIAIDNGLTVMTKKMRNVLDFLDEDWDRRRLVAQTSGDQPNIQAGEGIKMADTLSVGFYLGPGEDGDHVSVFNLLKGRDEEKMRAEIRPLDEQHANTLDDNQVWSEIRLLRFESDIVGTYLDSEVSTDPGAEVIKNGVAFFVVSSNGTTILIESPQTGAVHSVDISELTPGRRNHTNSHNYQAGKVAGSFDAGEKAALAVGDFIWVKPSNLVQSEYTNITRMLACINVLDGDELAYYYAADGMQQREKINAPHIKQVSDDFAEYLAGDKLFNVFKDAVVRGHDVERLAAGKHKQLTLVCLGFTGGQDKTEKKDWREKLRAKLHEKAERERFLSRHTKDKKADVPSKDNVDVVGDGGLKDRLDSANEAVKKGGDPKIKADAALKPVANVGDSTGEGSSSGTGMAMLAILAVGGAFYFMSQ